MTETTLQTIEPGAYAGWIEANRGNVRYQGPFHDPAWLRASALGTGFDLAFMGVYDGKDLKTVVPGYLARRGPFRLFGSPLPGTMTSYLGPVSIDPSFDDATRRQMIFDCVAFARRQWHVRYARVTIRDASEPRSEPLPGWREQRPKSYRLDLSPGEEALFAGLKANCRRNVRKAAREGVEIVPIDEPDLFFRILQDTLQRHGTSSWQSPRFFEALMHDLPPRGLLWAWGARYDERIISAGLFLHDETEMHFISGASLSGYGSLPTSYLLHWHAIATAAKEGLRVFNSEASGVRSIDQFKETFNPVREQRDTFIWAPQSARVAERAYRSLHDRLGHLRGRVAAG